MSDNPDSRCRLAPVCKTWQMAPKIFHRPPKVPLKLCPKFPNGAQDYQIAPMKNAAFVCPKSRIMENVEMEIKGYVWLN